MQVNNMKKIIFNIQGFSVAGLLVAAGMMGGLTMVLAQLTKQQFAIQRRAESGAEINEMSLKITRILQNEQACLNTIGKGTDLSLTTPPPDISSIHDKNNPPNIVFTEGQAYRNRLIKVRDISLEDINLPNSETGELNIQVTFVKRNPAVKGKKEDVKKFSITVELDGSGKVVRCTSHQDSSVAAAKKAVCTQWGGIYNPLPGTCSHATASKRCPGPADPNNPQPSDPEQQYLVGFNDDMSLDCSILPSSTPHPVATATTPGRNCYLLTTYLASFAPGINPGDPIIRATLKVDGSSAGSSYWREFSSSSHAARNIPSPLNVAAQMLNPGINLYNYLHIAPWEKRWGSDFNMNIATCNNQCRAFHLNVKLNCNTPPDIWNNNPSSPPLPVTGTYTEYFRKTTTYTTKFNQEIMYHYCCK